MSKGLKLSERDLRELEEEKELIFKQRLEFAKQCQEWKALKRS